MMRPPSLSLLSMCLAARSTPRFDYLLTSADGSPTSKQVQLNGRTLMASANGTLPQLDGLRAHGQSVKMPPLSFGFFVWPEANVKACYTERQLIDEKHAESFSAEGGPAAKPPSGHGSSKRSKGKAKEKGKQRKRGKKL